MAGTAPATVQTTSAPSSPGRDARYTAPLAVLTTLFFMWGFLTCLNDFLIPHLKAVFELNYFRVMLVNTAFFAAYFVMSLPSGLIVKKIGYKNGIIIGLIAAGVGCVLFYPAAGARSYGMFLFALFVLASGITLLQVAANPFVAVLGKPETASARLTLTQAFNSLATTVAPFFGAAFILSNAVKSSEDLKRMTPAAAEAYRLAEASSVQHPYLGLAATLVLLAVAIALFKLPKIDGGDVQGGEARVSDDARHKSAWGYRHLVLGAAGIFLYVGAEVAIGSFLVSYFKEPYIGGLPEAQGAKLVSFYWGGAMVGRFIGAATLRLYKPGKVLAFHAFGASALVVLTMLGSGAFSMWAVIAVGLFNSIMFPTIFTLAIDGLGKHTSQGSGILCMAIVGGAVIPPVQGLLADAVGIHHCFIIPAACYLYIAWYGLKGHPAPRTAPVVEASASI
jgi:FHS family L-fucose permease-like MFS transporter